MRISRQPNRFIRLLGLKRLLVANVVLFALVVWGFSGEYLRNRDAQAEVDRLQTQADALSAQNAQLADLGTRDADPQILEKEARLKLDMREPGEHVVVVDGADDGGDAPAEQAVSRAAPAPPQSNAEQWWHYFFQ
jgi:cell division protein FtsB